MIFMVDGVMCGCGIICFIIILKTSERSKFVAFGLKRITTKPIAVMSCSLLLS